MRKFFLLTLCIGLLGACAGKPVSKLPGHVTEVTITLAAGPDQIVYTDWDALKKVTIGDGFELQREPHSSLHPTREETLKAKAIEESNARFSDHAQKTDVRRRAQQLGMERLADALKVATTMAYDLSGYAVPVLNAETGPALKLEVALARGVTDKTPSWYNGSVAGKGASAVANLLSGRLRSFEGTLRLVNPETGAVLREQPVKISQGPRDVRGGRFWPGLNGLAGTIWLEFLT